MNARNHSFRRRYAKARQQNLDLGGLRAVKIGAPPALEDLYYELMEMGWPAFSLLVSVAFLSINGIFGVLYAYIPGAVANAVPGSVIDGFFFSVDTLATVGYGTMAPANHLGHALATVEVLIGIFFTASTTGLVFARFSRPRSSLLFSRVAVVDSGQGSVTLMVRVASTRSRPLADVSAQMTLVRKLERPDGRSHRQFIELPLVRSRNPMLGLVWTLLHKSSADSPFVEALLQRDSLLILVTVGGLDTLLASPVFGGHTYTLSDLRMEHEFVDIVRELKDGELLVDLARLHDTQPILDRSISNVAI